MSVRSLLCAIACLAAVLLSGCEVPTAVSVQEWEYKCWESDREDGQNIGFVNHLEQTFNGYGSNGWEMVGYAMNNGANTRYVCFKRPVQS